MDQATAVRFLARLGVMPMDIERLRRTPYAQAVSNLDALKATVKGNWKKLAFDLHPDRTGNDPVLTEEFKSLTEVKDAFLKIEVQAPQPVAPQQVHQVVFVHMTTVRTAATTATSYNVRPSTGGHARPINGYHFVNMKPG